jgi:hypothetical protein
VVQVRQPQLGGLGMQLLKLVLAVRLFGEPVDGAGQLGFGRRVVATPSHLPIFSPSGQTEANVARWPFSLPSSSLVILVQSFSDSETVTDIVIQS